MSYVISALIGFILGSLPTAYLLTKKVKGIDITKEGSKNVGAFNTYDVTKSKLLGIIVFIIDFAKGFFAVLIVIILFPSDPILPMLALFCAVLSHCFNVWIKFKGGRGLATTAGGLIIVSIPVLCLWLLLWVISFAYKKNIIFSNFVTTFLVGILCITNNETLLKWSENFQIIRNDLTDQVILFTGLFILLCLVILVKHISPIREWIATNKNIRNKNHERL
ncbi:MAG: glycerol-3-phosphate acyltransferase [Ignavibacteriales bacterium]|nr:glycerol-3-phosphate acyltransferase [Ignavibacteriales bacterium]